MNDAAFTVRFGPVVRTVTYTDPDGVKIFAFDQDHDMKDGEWLLEGIPLGAGYHQVPEWERDRNLTETARKRVIEYMEKHGFIIKRVYFG